MELFKINDEFMVDLNKEWISTIKEFKRILVRDKDRHKKQAQKEFTFIYHYCDYSSQFSKYPEDERGDAALKNADMDIEMKDVFKDKDLITAIDAYNRLKETRSLRIIRNAWKAIDSLNIYLDLAVINDPKGANDMISTLSKIGSLIESIKKIEIQVKTELENNTSLRGGHEKGIEEDPD